MINAIFYGISMGLAMFFINYFILLKICPKITFLKLHWSLSIFVFYILLGIEFYFVYLVRQYLKSLPNYIKMQSDIYNILIMLSICGFLIFFVIIPTIKKENILKKQNPDFDVWKR
jgi:hypothetical protein